MRLHRTLHRTTTVMAVLLAVIPLTIRSPGAALADAGASVAGAIPATVAPAYPGVEANQEPDPIERLGVEKARLRDSAGAATAGVAHQIDRGRPPGAAKSQQEAVPAWDEYIATVHEARHDAERAVVALGRVEGLFLDLGIDPKKRKISAEQMDAAVTDWLRTAA